MSENHRGIFWLTL